jgi:hypothetical protein
VPLLVLASRLGFARIEPGTFEAAAAAMEEVSRQCRPSSESFVNPAKSLALDIVGTLPVVWGGSPLAAVAARRFASLLMLNAKYPALSGYFPEAGYDQVAILDGPFAPAPAPAFPAAEDFGASLDLPDDPDDGQPEPRLVLLADTAGEHPAVTRMRAAASSVAANRGLLVSELVMEGADPLRRLASVTQMLDYTSAYLGIACGLDPLASPARDDVRDLAERAGGGD